MRDTIPGRDSEWEDRFTRLYEWEDQRKTEQTIREHLLYLNSGERIRAGYGHYFVDFFKIRQGDEYPGADVLSGWWYHRNLRIFTNILELIDSPEERILLIIGAGHLPILRHVALASPEVELVDVGDVLE